MTREAPLKGIFIIAAAAAIPLLSDLVTPSRYSFIEMMGAGFYFFLAALSLWPASRRIVGIVRTKFRIAHPPLQKFLLQSLSCAAAAIVLMLVFAAGWMQVSKEIIGSASVYQACASGALFSVLFGMVHEARFLSTERILDNKIVKQLDDERVMAELTTLNSELDPHFLFNSLVTLSHLISTDADKAYLFNAKLAEVYKYILQNKGRELVSMDSEISFIQDYMYLLQIRHDDKLRLELQGDQVHGFKSMLLPLSLQTLVENAIKHNQFSEHNPLHIRIQVNGQYVKITNNLQPKPYPVESTRTGLKNLSSRYRLTCHRDIIIEKTPQQFTVKLPIIHHKS